MAAASENADRPTQDAGVPEGTKERFREALERKNAAAHRSAEAARNTGSVHGPEVGGSAPRMFRRKSG